VLLFVVLALFAVACGSDSGDTSAAERGSDTVADTADGGQIDFGSLEGSDTMLWFWAPW